MSTQPRRLLFLVPFAPRLDATHGGARVAAQLLEALATQHQIALVYLRGRDEPSLDPAIAGACALVQEVARPWSGSSALQRLGRAVRLLVCLVVRGQPLWVTDCASAAFNRRLRDIVDTWRPDIVHFECHVMGQYVGALSHCGAPRILTEYEPGTRAAPYMLRAIPILSRLVHAVDRRAWLRWESHTLRQVRSVVVFTEADRAAVAALGQSTPIVCIPFGTRLPEAALDPLGEAAPSLLFVGSFIHPPNVDAARRLIEGILPLVRNRFPDARLRIVGDQPPPSLRRLAGDGVELTGRVPAVEPYLEMASVVVAPLRLGGGMRVKVLEAMAAGKAVVASPLATEGLQVADGEQLCVAETDQEFADQIVRLLEDPEQRASLAERARRWACANLGWDAAVANYARLYASLSTPRPFVIPPALQATFDGLEGANLRWCVLRLPHQANKSGGDIDVLVHPDDLGPATRALRQHGFVRLPGGAPGYHFITYDPRSNAWLWMHFSTRLAFGPWGLLDAHLAAECLERRRQGEEFPALSADDAFWELLLHCLVDKGRIAERHRLRLNEMVEHARYDGPLAQGVARLVPADWSAQRMWQCARDLDWAPLERLAPALRQRWQRASGVGLITRARMRAAWLLLLVRQLRQRRGLSVAVLGPDGAGKSTLIAGLEASIVLPTRTVYMGLTGGVLPHVDRVRLPLLVVPGRALVFWSRYLRALVHQMRGRLVLFDRYIYDSRVPTPYPLSRLGRIYRWLDGHTCPAPDVTVVLDAPGAVMFGRKGEYSPDTLEEWRRRFAALTLSIPRAEVVDASRPAEVVLADVAQRIWRHYAARWQQTSTEAALAPSARLTMEAPR